MESEKAHDMHDLLVTFWSKFSLDLFSNIQTSLDLMHVFRIIGEGRQKGHQVQKIELSIFGS